MTSTTTGDGKEIADQVVVSCRPFEELCLPCDYKERCPYFHNRWDQQDRYGIKQDVSYVRNLLETHERNEIRFLQNSSTSRDIHDGIVTMIRQSAEGEDICITGYFDSLLVKDLLDSIERKAKVRIISGILKDTNQDRANKNKKQNCSLSCQKEPSELHV